MIADENRMALLARRRLTSQIDHDRARAVQEAEHIADEAKRIASDIEGAITGGKVAALAQEIHHLLVRATQLKANKDALELFDAALPVEGEKK